MELTVLLFLPTAAAVIIAFLPQSQEQYAKWIALGGSVAALALSLVLFFDFDHNADGFSFVVREEWVDLGSFNLQYALGVDGISLPLVVLTTFLTLASVLVSFSVTNRPRLYYALLMILSTSVLGVFMSLDFMLFFLFWELDHFPKYQLIYIRGSCPK